MPQQSRDDECRRLAKDFLRRAESAPTKQEREDFLDMARAIERAAAKVQATGRQRRKAYACEPLM
jgi:hypothetical protein